MSRAIVSVTMKMLTPIETLIPIWMRSARQWCWTSALDVWMANGLVSAVEDHRNIDDDFWVESMIGGFAEEEL